MKWTKVAVAMLLLLVPAIASDLTIVIGSVDTSGNVVEGEYFSLMVSYTIFNSKSTDKTIDSLKLELQLPNSVTGTTQMNLPTVVVPAGSSVTKQVVVQSLKAIDNGSKQKIVVNLQATAEPNTLATTSFVFDIAETTTFSLNIYPEEPALGQWVRVSGDVWPVTTVFVGEDASGNKILIQNRTMGGQYSPQLVLIVTPWGTYKTMSDFRGTFSTFIPAGQEGEHLIIATIEGGKTASKTLKVKGFQISLEAVPQKLKTGETTTIVGRVQAQDWSRIPVKLTIGGTEKSLTTDIHGIFQTTFTPQKAGDVVVTAVVNQAGKYATEEITIQVEQSEEQKLHDSELKILTTLPTSVLAGTTVTMTGTIMREGLVPAILTITTPPETIDAVNSTDGKWSLSFVAPQEPGFYPITIVAKDSNGTNTKQAELRVVPFSESIVEIHPDKPQYAPYDNATITYSVDLTQPIKTEAHIRVRWYGQVVYEETKPFSKALNGTITLQLDPGTYEVEVESLGNINKASFQAFTSPGSADTTQVQEQDTSVKGVLSSNLTLPVIIGVLLFAVVLFV